jgi:hypothetical protein
MDHTTNPTEGIPLDVVQHTLWHFGDEGLGVQPGKFVSRLLVTISAADAENRAKLASVFPDEVRAFTLALKPRGFLALRERAKPPLSALDRGFARADEFAKAAQR